MKQWIRSMVLLAVPAVVWGCKSDPTVPGAVGVPAKLVATPAVVLVSQGDSKSIAVTLVDSLGNPVPGEFTLTAPTDAGVTVVLDTTQGLIYDASGNLVQKTGNANARYTVSPIKSP